MPGGSDCLKYRELEKGSAMLRLLEWQLLPTAPCCMLPYLNEP